MNSSSAPFPGSLRYRKPEGVEPVALAGRPLLTTPQGGRVALDRPLLALWEAAARHTLDELLARPPLDAADPADLRAAVACLAEAGLLERDAPDAVPPAPAGAPPTTGPRVSAVLVGYNSRNWLEQSLPSLLAQTYQPVEVLVVDNASGDGTLDWLAEHHPQVRTIRLEEARSLAGALNEGVAAASGEFFLLLNPDVLLGPDALAHLVAVAETDPSCAAVAAKLKLWWAPAFLNGLGNRVGPFSWGTDLGLGHLDLGQFDTWEQVPSACFAAALVTRAAWESIGEIDPGFPLYYEDNEWSYRARLLGYHVRAAPAAEVLHAFSSRVPDGTQTDLPPNRLRNVAYGRLRFAARITGRSLARFLGTYLLEDLAGLAAAAARLQTGRLRAYLGAWETFLRDLPALRAARRALAGRRALTDSQLFALQKTAPPTFIWRGLPELTWDLVRHHYAPLMRAGATRPVPELMQTSERPQLLIISHDVVGEKMAGPGMRYLETARALADDLQVTLAAPGQLEVEAPGVRLAPYQPERPAALRSLATESDVILFSMNLIERLPFLEELPARRVVDLYDPFLLENLHYYQDEPLDVQQSYNRRALAVTNRLARSGDFFLCASERQRDFWLGVLAANGRVNPLTFRQDPRLRDLIDVVGIGHPDRPPRARPYLKGQHPAVPAEARLVLWGGGIWNWLDPLTLIRTWPAVVKAHPKARLVILGTRHPNPDVPRHQMAARAVELAREIGALDETILFLEWVPYEDREALLAEADVGVTLHPVHLETRYALRTRMMDYFWARLPVLITEGDVTGEWVAEYGLGEVVPPHDVGAVGASLIRLLKYTRDAWEPNYQELGDRFLWRNVVAPLRSYCLQGAPAPDRGEIGAGPESLPTTTAGPGLWTRGLHVWRAEGFRALLHRGWRYLQWRLSR